MRPKSPKPVALLDPDESYKKILAAAGKAKFVGLNDFGQEVYVI